ncbi:MAG TPA: hypothetical protein PKM41_13830 [Deltaproteobacteria bacterium]|jgi:predicted small lipoprotein YifL|nr:hypothetical protein [Deltaproteobacteria bacterium]HOI08559.1 hypothetical protein [Deltaproteobacteria bacterium]
MKVRLALAALALALSGCGYLGPTPGEVKVAHEAVFRAVMASADQKSRIDMQYSNIADVSSRNPEGTAVFKAKVMEDSAHAIIMDGTCEFNGYFDKETGYTIDGSMQFRLDDIRQKDPDAVTGSIGYSVTMTGGRIESLDMTISKDEDGAVVTDLAANGKKIDLEKWAEAERMMRSLVPSLVGR